MNAKACHQLEQQDVLLARQKARKIFQLIQTIIGPLCPLLVLYEQPRLPNKRRRRGQVPMLPKK